MTDLLKDTLTAQAAGAEPPELDLDAVIALGERRVRRRRTGTLLGTAFVALAVIAAGLTAVRIIQADPEPAAKPPLPFTERRVTYAVNGVIHFGDAEIATGTTRVERFVQTDAGFVFTDHGEIKLADGRTTRKLADATSNSPLAASGPLAGWEEPTSSGSRTVIRDLRTDQVVYDVNHPSGPHTSPADAPTGLVALDGDSAYFTTGGGLLQLDVRTHLRQVIRPAYAVLKSLTVASSMYVYLTNGPEGIGKYVSIKRPPDQRLGQALQTYSSAPITVGVSTVGSSVVVATGGTLRVYDSQGRQHVAVTGTKPKMFGQWLNDSTFTAADAPAPDQPVNLLKCGVAEGLTMSCGVTKPAVAAGPEDLTFPSN